MEILLKMATLLVAAAGAFASELPCELWGDELWCSSKELTAPPAGLWPNVTSLVLDYNPITNFSQNALAGFPNLVDFSAQNCLLVEIDLGQFVKLPKLETLNLYRNYIKTIIPAPEGTVFENLLIVLLERNSITTLDPDFLFNTPILMHLNIANNPIIVSPGQPIFNHNTIETMYFGEGSNLADSNITAMLAGVPNIGGVGIQHARLYNISGVFVNYKDLVWVDVDYNDITEITANTFPSEGKLRSLSFRGNPLHRLDIDALNKSMSVIPGILDIRDTPLACGCAYEGLFWWAEARDIIILAQCDDEELCSFTRRSSSASPA